MNLPKTHGIVDFIKEQIAVDPKDSKKFLAMQFGVISTLAISLCAGGLLVAVPAVAASVASIAQISITAVGGLVCAYLTGQAAVEFRANSVLKTAAEDPYGPAYGRYDEPMRPLHPDCPQPEQEAAGTPHKPFAGDAFTP